MSGLLRPVTALLLAAAILMMGNGLNGVLLPIRAQSEGFANLTIGLMGSAYYAGLVAGCFLCPLIIARVGHIRAFVAFTASATITPLLHAMWIDPLAWSAMRALNGLCFAGLFMGIESWLSAASTPETRGRVLGTYTLIHLTVVTGGMQFIGLADPQSFELFSWIAILYSLAAVPVALTGTLAPTPPRRAKLRLGWLTKVSPAAVLGCMLAGIANSAFWTLAPVYAERSGLAGSEVALFLTVIVICGALGQWPMGAMSDRFGRRKLIGVAGVVAASAGLALFAVGREPSMIFVLAGIYGFMAFPIYTMCVAHANDMVAAKRAVEVSGGLLLVFSMAATVGPTLASILIEHVSPGALFLHSAVAHCAIAVVMLVRAQLRPKPPADHKDGFVVVPRTTPAVFELDPRGAPAGDPAPEDLAATGDRRSATTDLAAREHR